MYLGIFQISFYKLKYTLLRKLKNFSFIILMFEGRLSSFLLFGIQLIQIRTFRASRSIILRFTGILSLQSFLFIKSLKNYTSIDNFVNEEARHKQIKEHKNKFA